MNMKSYALCPVSDKRTDERVARINAVFTVLILIVSVLIQSIFPVIFLAFDFLLRASDYSEYSLIRITSKNIVKYLGLGENIINAGPKIFAARLGFVFSSLILLLIFLGSYAPALILAGVLATLSFLEAAFGFCIACEVYPFMYRLLYKVKFQ
jgi:hypothetical protein